MHIKIEKMLPLWLAPIYLTPVFTFNEDFEYDKKMLKRKERARKKALGIEESGDEDDDSDDDDDDEESE